MTAEPRIYTKNYITSESVFTSGYGTTFASRMADGDRLSQYITSGANSDLTTAIIQADFYEAGVAQLRTIDTLVLLNHNLKEFYIQWYDGVTWTTVVNETVVAVADNVWTFTPVAAYSVRIGATKTQTANQEKAFGELVACANQITFTQEMTQYRVSSRQEAVELKLADGTIRRTVMKSAPNRSNKYEANVQFKYLTSAQLLALKTIKESGAAFLWHPESSSRVDEIYYVHWVGAFQYQYVTTYKGAGHQLDMQLKEA